LKWLGHVGKEHRQILGSITLRTPRFGPHMWKPAPVEDHTFTGNVARIDCMHNKDTPCEQSEKMPKCKAQTRVAVA
jgi:hypothetical protein